jgi:hypothetical protein
MVGLVNPTGGARWLWIGFVLAIWSGSRASGVPGCPVASWPRLASYLQIRRARARPEFPGCPAACRPRLASYSQIRRARARPGVRGARWLPGLDWLRTCKFVGLGARPGVRGARWLLAPDWLRTRKLVGFGCVRGFGVPGGFRASIGFVLANSSSSRASGGPGCPVARWPRIGFVLANSSGSGASGVPDARRPLGLDWLRTRKFIGLGRGRGSGFPAPSWPRIGFVLANWSGSGAFGFPRRPVASWPRLASYLQVDRARGRPGFRVSGGFLAPDWLRTRKLVGLRCVRVSEAPGGFLAPIGFVLANRSARGRPGCPVARWPRIGFVLASRSGSGPSGVPGFRWLLGPDWLRTGKLPEWGCSAGGRTLTAAASKGERWQAALLLP